MKSHRVSELFPLMSESEFGELKADIAANGQREPIWVHDGQIIDGRNRYRACVELGLEPQLREWGGQGSLVAFVVSLNLHRRHLSAGQRAMVAAEMLPLLEAEAKERQRKAGAEGGRVGGRGKKKEVAIVPPPLNEAGQPTQPLTQEQQELADHYLANRGPLKAVPHPSTDLAGHYEEQHRKKELAREQAARTVNVASRYVQDAKKVAETAPDLAEQVKAGKLTLPQARNEVKRREKAAELERKAEEAASAGQSDRWEIRVGDCLDELATVASGTVNLVFADPPYNIGIDYGSGERADSLPDADYLAWCERWLAECTRVLTSDGSLWVMIGDEYAAEYALILKRLGLHRRAWVKWYETFGVCNSAGTNFSRCSRHVFYCVKDSRRFVWNLDAVSRQSDRQVKYGDARANPGGKVWDDVWCIPRLVGNAAERIGGFPTQLPVELLSAVVGCSSDPGDLVLDPFNGSGTTGVAALRLGRRYLGIEKSPHFAALATQRLKGECGGSKAG